jgi:transposase
VLSKYFGVTFEENMGVKRDRESLKKLEQRRRLAAELLRQGVQPAEVARWVESSRQSVMRWSRQLEQDGLRGLRRAGRIGRPPLLTDRKLEQLAKRLKPGSLAAACVTERWTLRRIGTLIEREFGVRLAASSVWRTLHRMGWSIQRPTIRARQQNPAALTQWKQASGATLKKALRGKNE